MHNNKILKLLAISMIAFNVINVFAEEDIKSDDKQEIADVTTNNNDSNNETIDDNSEENNEQNENVVTIKNGLFVENGKKYYYENDKKVQGFKKVGEDLYFFSSIDKAATQGWKVAYGNVWYQNEEGKVVRGLQVIDGKKYYFNAVTGYQEVGFKTLGIDLYFFSSIDKAATQGWKIAYGNVWYQNSEGKVVRGLQVIDGKKYYFNKKTGYQEIGFKKEGDDLYFFSSKDKAATQGWKAAYGNLWYQDENGIVLKDGWHTISGKEYYSKDGYVLRGIKRVSDKTYYFDDAKGNLLTGWIQKNGKTFYASNDKTLVKSYQTINNKEYYFKDNYEMVKGLIKINGKAYYYNSNTGEKMYKSFTNNWNRYTLDSKTGELLHVQYIPKYYNQKDGRWSNIKYGGRYFGNTGCAPTSMAMAYTSILEREVLPTHVADYLYYETNEYNKQSSGTSGLGIIYASNRFNVKLERINSKNQLIEALGQGKIVFAAMADGKFATKSWNHAILVYDLEGSKVNTISADPLTEYNNGLVPIDTIWREKSNDPDDISGGAALYALSPNIQEITD